MSRRRYKSTPPLPNTRPPVDAVRVHVPPDGSPEVGVTAESDEARQALGQRVAELEAAERHAAALQQAQVEALRQAHSADPIDHLFPHASPASKTWLRQHREALDQVKLLRLQGAHAYALADGIAPDTEAYFQRLEHAINHSPAAHQSHELPLPPPDGAGVADWRGHPPGGRQRRERAAAAGRREHRFRVSPACERGDCHDAARQRPSDCPERNRSAPCAERNQRDPSHHPGRRN